jgi:Domain of unknown function (DUF4252)
MKKLVVSLTLAAMAACPLASFGQASIEKDPAYLPINKLIDLKANPPEVDVNLPPFLLKDALSGLNLTNQGDSGKDLTDLVKDVKMVRVVVIQVKESNRAAMKKAIKALRAELDDKWTAVVNVPEDNVGIYVKSDEKGEQVAGVALTVFDGDEAVIGNVVGNVSIGKLLKLATQSGKLPPDLLKKLNGIGGQPGAKKKEEEGDGGAGTNKPAEAPESSEKTPATK